MIDWVTMCLVYINPSQSMVHRTSCPGSDIPNPILPFYNHNPYGHLCLAIFYATHETRSRLLIDHL